MNEKGIPITGASIWVKQTGGGWDVEAAISDAAGKYSISGLEAEKNFTIFADAEGYENGELVDPSLIKDMTILKDIVLKKSAK